MMGIIAYPASPPQHPCPRDRTLVLESRQYQAVTTRGVRRALDVRIRLPLGDVELFGTRGQRCEQVGRHLFPAPPPLHNDWGSARDAAYPRVEAHRARASIQLRVRRGIPTNKAHRGREGQWVRVDGLAAHGAPAGMSRAAGACAPAAHNQPRLHCPHPPLRSLHDRQ